MAQIRLPREAHGGLRRTDSTSRPPKRPVQIKPKPRAPRNSSSFAFCPGGTGTAAAEGAPDAAGVPPLPPLPVAPPCPPMSLPLALPRAPPTPPVPAPGLRSPRVLLLSGRPERRELAITTGIASTNQQPAANKIVPTKNGTPQAACAASVERRRTVWETLQNRRRSCRTGHPGEHVTRVGGHLRVLGGVEQLEHISEQRANRRGVTHVVLSLKPQFAAKKQKQKKPKVFQFAARQCRKYAMPISTKYREA